MATRDSRRRSAAPRVHFLDVGGKEYGDAVLCELGGRTVLIDGAHPGDQVGKGGHPGIPQQLGSLLGAAAPPYHVDLLIVTHTHLDHVGCLPHLVTHGLLTADWALVADPQLGWGRSDQDVALPLPDPRVQHVVAALREETPSPQTDKRDVTQMMADAAGLEQTYLAMLDALKAGKTRVVRYGRDSHRALVTAFAGIGMEILGPTRNQLELCRAVIARRIRDAIDAVSDMLRDADEAQTDADLLWEILHPGTDPDPEDAIDRPGPAINLQSIVTRFQVGTVKLLFAGDMQFADPQTSEVADEVAALRARIRAEAPFSLVKLSHHGSDNALDASVLAEWGATPYFAICAGEQSMSHPNAKVLRLLDAERGRVTWARTDHNGLSTFTFGRSVKVEPARGDLDDARPNAPDIVVRPPAPPAPSRLPAIRHEPVEVVTRVPAGVARVVVSIDVEPGTGAGAAPSDDPFRLAGGRTLPPLLFVTNRERLARNVGATEAAEVLAAIGAASLHDVPGEATDSRSAVAAVRERLAARPDVRGVVIVGGYDVVPSERRDCLPAALRSALGANDDADDFYVWSDDGYGDIGDRTLPVPVSRVPDGRSAELLMAALSAGDVSRGQTRRGVRNTAREFAAGVFAPLPGADPLLISEPTTSGDTPPLDADRVYLMLHGAHDDGTRYWGETETGSMVEAVDLRNIPRPGARVVFTGCCWGALTVDQPALRSLPGVAPAPRAANASIALRFLAHGATAFVGCTGAHYSPITRPYDYFGGPMHRGFWNALAGGLAPAEALLAAKMQYVRDFPHGRRSQAQQAIEYKILNQYTCLGLGW